MSEPNDGGLFVDVKPGAARAPTTPGAKKDVKKRWLFVGVGVTVFAVVVSSLMSTEAPPPRKVAAAPQMINLTPKNVDERSWQARSQQDIQAMRDENTKLKADLANVITAIRDMKTNPPAANASLPLGVVPPPSMNASGTAPLTQLPVPPPPVPSAPPLPSTNTVSVPPPFTSEPPPVSAEPLVFAPERVASRGNGPELEAKVRYRKNAQSGMMVAGAFAPIVLLNGIDAGTSSGSRSNPQPILIRVQDHAVLPGAGKYQLRSCFLLASAYGELSAERVYVRLARLSCVDNRDRLVLSVPVQGYLVDSDGTLGLRGKVTDRQGARLGKALLAGFAEGLSSALGGAQGTLTSSVLGSATSIGGDDALRSSGLSGAGTAAGQLAQFYLKEAQSIFPVIYIQAGRTGTVVFTEDVNLGWGNVDAQFVREVEPQSPRG